MLVATDVAARGLDVKDIAYVINYDFPVDGVEVGFGFRYMVVRSSFLLTSGMVSVPRDHACLEDKPKPNKSSLCKRETVF